jgi:hypothetical protein
MSNYYRYAFNDQMVIGVGPDVIPNGDVHWETTTMSDIGLDLGLFDNKLYLTTDYYSKKPPTCLLRCLFQVQMAMLIGFLFRTQEVC